LSFGFLFGETKSRSETAVPVEWFVFGFLAIFWAIGLGLLYAACRSKFAKHRVTAAPGTVTLRRELFGRTKDIVLPAADVTSVRQVEFYQQNYQPVRGIEIRCSRGKIRFGSTLAEAEKAWLVADMQRVIMGPPEPVPRTLSPAGARRSYFSVALPRQTGQLGAGIVCTIIGVVFVIVGLFFIDPGTGMPGDDAPAFVRVLDFMFDILSHGFVIVWTLMAVLMGGIGIALLIWSRRVRNREIRVEGTDSEIAIRTYRFGRVLEERSFPRQTVADIRTSNSGSSNGKTMKRIELIADDRVETVASWMDSEKADAFAAEVRSAML
jgi:hypothetical protein